MLNDVLCFLGNLPVSEILVLMFQNLLASMLYAYEDGTASKFQNVGTKSSDAGRLPKKHNTAFNTQQKFEIECHSWLSCGASQHLNSV